jgi:hypothetical protein
MPTRDKIFISYSHLDGKLFDEFKTMMAPASWQGLEVWDDTQIPPGAQWKQEIEKALASARIAVLLVSRNFLASDFIVKQELPPLLKAAREEGVTIFWICLGACLVANTEISTYQAAHNISQPLDGLTKAKRQVVLKEICEKLIRAAVANFAPPAESSQANYPNSGTSAAGSPNMVLECLLLLTEALEMAHRAAQGGGPTTVLHRQLDVARKWLEQGVRLLPDCRSRLSPSLIDALEHLSKQALPLLLAEAKLALPPAGDTDKKTNDSDYFRDSRDAALLLLRRIDEQLESNTEFMGVRNGERKWGILGFRNREDFDDYLYPPVRRLTQSSDPMQRDLFEWLLKANEFTPRQLTQEGYRKDLVMDTVNALIKEQWAAWTDLTLLGADGKGKVTDVGKRLLRQSLDLGAARS